MFRLWLTVVIAAIVLAGCGGSGPNLISVDGTLTLDGQPLANKTLLFTPINGTPGHGAGGSSDGNGKFTLKAVVPGATRDYDGVTPGSYRVSVFEPAFSTGVAVDETSDDPAVALAPEMNSARSNIPRIYGSDASPLEVEVPEAGGSIVVALLSKPAR